MVDNHNRLSKTKLLQKKCLFGAHTQYLLFVCKPKYTKKPVTIRELRLSQSLQPDERVYQ